MLFVMIVIDGHSLTAHLVGLGAHPSSHWWKPTSCDLFVTGSSKWYLEMMMARFMVNATSSEIACLLSSCWSNCPLWFSFVLAELWWACLRDP
jgi:hypothetical protein